MGIRLKEWYETFNEFVNKRRLYAFLKCVHALNIKLPYFILIKILELNIPPFFVYIYNTKEWNSINYFLNTYFVSTKISTSNVKIIFYHDVIEIIDHKDFSYYEKYICKTSGSRLIIKVNNDEKTKIIFDFEIDYVKSNKSFKVINILNHTIYFTILPFEPQYDQFKKLYLYCINKIT